MIPVMAYTFRAHLLRIKLGFEYLGGAGRRKCRGVKERNIRKGEKIEKT